MESLKKTAKKIRMKTLEIVHCSGTSHIGSAKIWLEASEAGTTVTVSVWVQTIAGGPTHGELSIGRSDQDDEQECAAIRSKVEKYAKP